MSTLSALANLVGGFGQGYMQGKEKAHQRELDDTKAKLEEKRLELENKKLENDSAMLEKLHTVDEEIKPTQVYVVKQSDGTQHVYADEKLARQAAGADPSAQVMPMFSAGGQTFADKESATHAAASMNAPAAKMRRRAEVYQAYGREDLAGAAMQTYKMQLDNNRREMVQQFLNAKATGDVGAVVDAYNNQLPNGVHAELVQGKDGSQGIQLTKNGQPVGQPKPFDWDQIQQQIMSTPDNMVEIWRSNQDFKLRNKLADNDTRRTSAQVDETGARVGLIKAQTADVPNQAADRHTQAQASATSAAATAFNAHTARLGLTKPTISAAPDAKGGLNFVAPSMTLDSNTGQYTLGAPQVQPAAGLQYPAGYVAGQRNSLGGLGLGGGAPLQIDPAALDATMKAMQQEADRRAAARGGGAAPTAPTAPATPAAAPTDPRKPVSFTYPTPNDQTLQQRLYGMVAQAESGGQRYAPGGGLLTSPAGAKGEMQVMDATNLDPGYGVQPARNGSAAERARVGRDYLTAMVNHFGDVPKGLAAYNAGPGRVGRIVQQYGPDWFAHLPPETQDYVRKISAMRSAGIQG